MKLGIQIALAVIVIALAYAVYNSIHSRIAFDNEVKTRKDVVVERLKDIRTVQITFRNKTGAFAGNFEQLIQFLLKDSIPLVKIEGTVPDTLTEAKAVELGIVKKDTVMIAVKDTILKHYTQFDDLAIIPFSEGEKFVLQSGEIEKGSVKVKVFEAFAPHKFFLKGMDLSIANIDPEDGLKVGSMTDASTSGNWE
ncbi:MAG: hypothetical protein HUU48_05895 [Flavobacteriales bacterium]|nr:hypothetical protein [Flavobacteriales bacterium]